MGPTKLPLSKADLATATIECLNCQQQTPTLKLDIAPSIDMPKQPLSGRQLFWLKLIPRLGMRFSFFAYMAVASITIWGLTNVGSIDMGFSMTFQQIKWSTSQQRHCGTWKWVYCSHHWLCKQEATSCWLEKGIGQHLEVVVEAVTQRFLVSVGNASGCCLYIPYQQSLWYCILKGEIQSGHSYHHF